MTAWWSDMASEVWPAPDEIMIGRRYRFRFEYGGDQTMVALPDGRFRPLAWRIAWRLLVEMGA